MLIKACADLAKFFDFRLWLAGDGPERKDLEDLALSLAVKDIATFWGFIEDVRPLMWEADLFVLPSKTPEPFGIVALEAAATVAPCAEGRRVLDFDETCGWLVKPNDPSELAAAIKDALSFEETRKAKGASAAKKALKFDVSEIAGQYAALYRKLGL